MRKNILYLLIVALFSQCTHARDIYVAKDGNDSNDGSIENPYLTLAKASEASAAGDTVFIREGTYEELLKPSSSGTAGSPIIFTSYPGEKVIISAMQSLSNWTNDSGSVYKTTIDWNLGQENFVLNGEVAMDLARWPNNEDGLPFTIDSKRNTSGSNSDAYSSGQGNLTSSEIPNIDWTGGSLFFYGDKPGSGWLAWKEFITNSSSGRIDFDITKSSGVSWIYTFHAPADEGDFYLEGVKGALDFQNEWWFDTTSNELFVQMPNGSAPQDEVVKMRRRRLAVDLNNRSFIEIRNLAVFGGGIELKTNSNDNILYGISSFYGNHTQGVFTSFSGNIQSVTVNGSRNIVEKCEIGFGAATGLRLGGSFNTVKNCNIHDFDYLGSYDAPLVVRGSEDNIITENTIFNGGRDGINYNGKRCDVSYNDVSKSNLISDDCGTFYCVGNQAGTEIHHNWFHDTASRNAKFKAAGIYLDTSPEDISVHHNVVWNTEWTGIQMNWDALDIDVFNNTLINNSEVMGAWHKEGTAFSNVKVWNNLGSNNEFEPQSDKQNNLVVDNGVFSNAGTGDFSLAASSFPIDAGRIIDGITDGFIGGNPDVGAYEFGGEKWVAGIDWDPKLGPTGLGCFGLPGENCLEQAIDDADNDGVSDTNDICSDTPENTTVDSSGCAIFTLAPDNFSVLSTGESCRGSANGSIFITAKEMYNYTATITQGNIINTFTDNTELNDLAEGAYNVCITIAEASDFEQCFEVVIDAPDELSVSSKVDLTARKLSLNLQGSNDLYRIVLNGKVTVTDQENITLDLMSGKNGLTVDTNLDCQGKFEKTFTIGMGIVAYPNPVDDELYLYALEDISGNVTWSVFSLQGQMVQQGSEIINNDSLSMNLSSLPSGIYVVRISALNNDTYKRIVKK